MTDASEQGLGAVLHQTIDGVERVLGLQVEHFMSMRKTIQLQKRKLWPWCGESATFAVIYMEDHLFYEQIIAHYNGSSR